jgi:hypothetical protein
MNIFKIFKVYSIARAMVKYINIEDASTQVEIKGAETLVGSILRRFANIGSVQPINFATMMVAIKVTDTTTASFKF